MASRAQTMSVPRGRSRPGETAPSPFISGRISDNFWIILSPVVALLIMFAAWRFSGLSDLAVFSILFGLIVTGHHMPGWIRAFGEPAVYERHKARLWVSLAAVPLLVVLPAFFGLGVIGLTIAAAFDLWHVAMQQHGFGRIYAAKAGDVARRSARLDLVCVLTWYVTVVAWSDSWMEGIARSFRKAGLPFFDLLTPAGWAAAKWALTGVSVVLLVAYVANAVAVWREKRISTPNKHLLHFVAFAVLIWSYQFPSWYRAQSVQNLFHASQYFFMVWIYGNLSIRRDATRPGSFYRAIFGSPRGTLLFAFLVALYGTGAYLLFSSGYRLVGGDAERTMQIVGSIALTSLLLHYYVDSFIWKVRSKEVRTALAIRPADAAPEAAPLPIAPAAPRLPRLRQAAHAVAYFGIPILLIGIVGAGNRNVPADREIRQIGHEVELFPRSAYGHFNFAKAALKTGDRTTARRELTRAVELAPTFEGPARDLAELDSREGNHAAEIEHARLAVRAEPKDGELRYLYATALGRQKRLGEAESEYRAVIRLRPSFAGGYQGLGVIHKWRGDLGQAIPLFRKAAALDPDYRDAWCDLAGALATVGQTREALETLENYRARHPEDPVAAELERAIRADSSGQQINNQ
ncbi:MAG TPA: tetratricopeptide repeat protein [Thermoanaerobaculia bacterium]|nr:tetratricopeptide repeat protein [Thermoanaerobaculia bacterium]